MAWVVAGGAAAVWVVLLLLLTARSEPRDVDAGLLDIWSAMSACIARGLRTGGELPGSLHVKRRAKEINDRLLKNQKFPQKNYLKFLINLNPE